MSAVRLASVPLHDGWSLTCTGGPDVPAELLGKRIAAEVPGTTHTDLLRAELIPDPYLGMNEAALEWMWTASWRYETTFDAAAAEPGERVDLVFDGLDTVATVTLNGTEVARTFNMHRTYRFDVGALLLDGPNTLIVAFASALDYALAIEAEIGVRPRPYEHPYNAIRKMACSFGWDWGPDLQTAGMWKGVRLDRWAGARLATVRPLVTVEGPDGVVNVHVEIERADDAPLTVHATVAGVTAHLDLPAGATTGVVSLTVPAVELWNPVGYGNATLYDLSVTLHSGEVVIDSYDRRVGFRSVEIDQSKDAIGASFTYVVNGRRIFVKGANWIPDDHLMTRITPERLRRRLQQAIDANMNLIRVWGGGIYETDDFYDLCDELGLMVWQDFTFACAAYSEGEPILSEVTAEVRDNVTRLAPHASLVMYNGSNENIWGYWDWGWQWALAGRDWGLAYYEEVLPALLAELDPTRVFTPSSPFTSYHGAEEHHPNDPNWGTVHEWEVWNKVDYTTYRNYVPRFCSEFGYQGPATWATIERTLPVDELHHDHPAWLLHQKADQGNDKLDRGMNPHLPNKKTHFEEWHWETSLNQARAVRYGIEHYRSHWPTCAGAIVWQLNDCWPVTSWAAIDGDERPKPLWYALKAAFAPRLLTFQPRGLDGGNDPTGAVHLVAINETDTAWSETLTFTRMALDGTELAVATAHLAVEPGGIVTLPVPAHVREASDITGEVLIADAGYAGDDDHQRAVWTFAEDKDISYERAPYTASIAQVAGGYDLTVRATGFVRNLTVLADKVAPDAIVDRALVDLVAGDVAVLHIATTAQVAPEAFLAERVLVSVNSVVA